MKNLKDKIAVVTGAASGIGRSTAIQMLNEGATVIGCDINDAGLKETAALSAHSNRFHTYAFDIGVKAEIEKFSREVLSKFGHIDILVNNAGMSIGPYKLQQIPIEFFEKIIAVNIWGVIYCTHYFLPSLLSRPESSVINVSSVFGLFSLPTQAPYCSTKYAVRGFSESLRMELQDGPVAVTTIHPGGIKTGIVSNGMFHKESDMQRIAGDFERLAKSTPDYAAQKIIEGIKCKKKRVFIGLDAHVFYFLSRFWPSLLEWGAKLRVKMIE